MLLVYIINKANTRSHICILGDLQYAAIRSLTRVFLMTNLVLLINILREINYRYQTYIVRPLVAMYLLLSLVLTY